MSIKINGQDCNSYESFIRVALRQLCHIKQNRKGFNKNLITRDIEGYKKILKSKDPEHNAEMFLRLKEKRLREGIPVKDNLEIIGALMKMEEWVDE